MTQNSENDVTYQSNPYDLAGTIIRGRGFEQQFCMKGEDGFRGQWPKGHYCIFKYGGKCLEG